MPEGNKLWPFTFTDNFQCIKNTWDLVVTLILLLRSIDELDPEMAVVGVKVDLGKTNMFLSESFVFFLLVLNLGFAYFWYFDLWQKWIRRIFCFFLKPSVIMAGMPAAIATSGGTKKPFSYCPGGIDFSELKSPKMARRIAKHQSGMAASTPPCAIPPSAPSPSMVIRFFLFFFKVIFFK